jgi:hypothetical protein
MWLMPQCSIFVGSDAINVSKYSTVINTDCEHIFVELKYYEDILNYPD